MCGLQLSGEAVVDLGMSPLSNELVDPRDAQVRERSYPLRAYVCERCRLMQVPAFATPDRIFGEYAYFSSYSTTWLEHARTFAESIIDREGLHAGSFVVELASNDGYLLKEFRARSIPVLGIEPARNVAQAALGEGIPTIAEFFGAALAQRVASKCRPDLIVANNVLAHVPDLNDFVAGIAIALAPRGVATVEFPHLLRTIERGEFDTIYHEHFSYFSLHTARRAFERHGMRVVDVDELSTHGGSLRVYVAHETSGRDTAPAVARIIAEEEDAGLEGDATYAKLQAAAGRVKGELVEFLTAAKHEGKSVAGYGAPAKATTLLNYCGVHADLLPYTVDRSPHKQGRLIPGVRVPIEAPERIFRTKPDYVLVLPWNLKDEIVEQMADIRTWGGKFVVPIPSQQILE